MTLRTAILEHLSRQTEPVTVAHVARALDQSAYDTRAALHDLVDAGEVTILRSEGHGERFTVAPIEVLKEYIQNQQRPE